MNDLAKDVVNKIIAKQISLIGLSDTADTMYKDITHAIKSNTIARVKKD